MGRGIFSVILHLSSSHSGESSLFLDLLVKHLKKVSFTTVSLVHDSLLFKVCRTSIQKCTSITR